MYFVVLGIIIFILIFIIIEVSFYNKFQMIRIRISEAENNIDILLQKKFQLLERTIKIIEEENSKYQDEGLLTDLVKIKNKKINNFMLNKELESIVAEYRSLLDLDSKLSEINSIRNINFELVEVDNELNAAKKYYNEHIIHYNKLIRCFPSNIVAKLYSYTTKDFYSDEKIEIFEILKQK